MKKNYLLGIILLSFLIPFRVRALSANVDLTCAKTVLKPGETTTCTITGKTSEEVATVSAKIEVGDRLTLVSVKTDSSWQGDGEDGNIELYTDINKSGTFPIATFVVKANESKGVSTNISLHNVYLSDKNFKETQFHVSDLAITFPSNDNALKSLTVDGVSVPNFSPTNKHYQYDVLAPSLEITIGADKSDAKAKITGDLGTKKLSYGANEFKMVVTSESGISNTYTLVVNRPEGRELNKLLVNDKEIGLEKGIYEYTVQVDHDITKLTIDGVLEYPDFVTFVEAFGPREINDLEVGTNTFFVKTIDQEKQELTYTIHVERLDEVVTPGDDSKPVENPSTGVNGFYIAGGVVAILAIIGFIYMKKKNYFKQI